MTDQTELPDPKTVPCRNCYSTGPHIETVMTTGKHYAKLTCACGTFIRWMPKPNPDRVTRPAKHRDLVQKFSEGICQICHMEEKYLFRGESLEAHHIKEFIDGGESTRENILIVCTTCHEGIHRRRKQARKIMDYKKSLEAGGPVDAT